jgi:hypothetical protein
MVLGRFRNFLGCDSHPYGEQDFDDRADLRIRLLPSLFWNATQDKNNRFASGNGAIRRHVCLCVFLHH